MILEDEPRGSRVHTQESDERAIYLAETPTVEPKIIKIVKTLCVEEYNSIASVLLAIILRNQKSCENVTPNLYSSN